ncbi:hypothetical protein ACJZ2D_012168 [Fusarium nematophilum]
MLPFGCFIVLFASAILALPQDKAEHLSEAIITPTPTPTPTPSIKCDYKYCDERGTSWCFHFVPFTAIDPTLGPLPGETRTSIGPCGTKTADPELPVY